MDARTTSPTPTWPLHLPPLPPPHPPRASSPATRLMKGCSPGSTTTTTLTAVTCPHSSITTRISTTQRGISLRCNRLAAPRATTFATLTYPMIADPHPQTWAIPVGPVCAPPPPLWAAAAPLQGPRVCLQNTADRLCHLLRQRRGMARGKVTVQSPRMGITNQM